MKKISNNLFFISILFFLLVISTNTQTVYAEEKESIIITITTNDEKAEDLCKHLRKENYEIYKDKNIITAMHKQDKKLNSSIPQKDVKSQYLIYGLALVVFFSTVILIVRISKRKKENEEYFEETYFDYPSYYSFDNNSQHINLKQRLSDMQVRQIYPYGYRTENNFLDYKYPTDNYFKYKHYNAYSEQNQFNLIRQRPRDY